MNYQQIFISLRFSGDVASLKDQSFTIQEGATYRLKMNFCVQREIVTGLKLVMKTSRKGIKGIELGQIRVPGFVCSIAFRPVSDPVLRRFINFRANAIILPHQELVKTVGKWRCSLNMKQLR